MNILYLLHFTLLFCCVSNLESTLLYRNKTEFHSTMLLLVLLDLLIWVLTRRILFQVFVFLLVSPVTLHFSTLSFLM